jgi:hypothetical protein
MAFTSQQLTDLDAAIADGVLVVQANGRRTEYRSLDEMIKLRNLMAAELAPSDTAPRTRRYHSFRRD